MAIEFTDGRKVDSGLVMYPSGHAKNVNANLKNILQHKFQILGELALEPRELDRLLFNLDNIEELDPKGMENLYKFNWKKLKQHQPIDE